MTIKIIEYRRVGRCLPGSAGLLNSHQNLFAHYCAATFLCFLQLSGNICLNFVINSKILGKTSLWLTYSTHLVPPLWIVEAMDSRNGPSTWSSSTKYGYLLIKRMNLQAKPVGKPEVWQVFWRHCEYTTWI
jgi:hypothetical protein